MDIDNLAQRVRSEASAIFYGTQWDPSWGDEICSMPCNPKMNFSKWGLMYWQIPGEFRPLVSDTNNLNSRRKWYEDLFFFHYGLNKKRIKKNFKHRNGQNAGRVFEDNFGAASCIYTNFYDETQIVGEPDLMQDVMDCLKSGPDGAQHFLACLLERDYRATTQRIHVYDLLKKPKEVHF